jgi:hypothetical protein
MNITPIFSPTHEFQTSIQMAHPQNARNLAALQNAIQVGDVATARAALSAFQQDVAGQIGPATLFAPDSQTGHDLQAVASSLKSNRAAARPSFLSLKG